MTFSKGKGTLDHNLEKTPWVEIDGRECYAVRKYFTPKGKGDCVSIPRRYYHPDSQSCRFLGSNDSFLITISQEIDKGAHKGNIIYPDVYELRNFILFTIKEQEGIQGGKTRGKVVPISQLYVYKERTQEEAKAENAEALHKALIKKKFPEKV